MSVYDSITQGLKEALEYEKGKLRDVKVDKITVSDLVVFPASRIKEIRLRQRMTQKLFAHALGVSKKTIEAWEAGKNTPSGCACRMLELLDRDDQLFEKYSVLVRK